MTIVLLHMTGSQDGLTGALLAELWKKLRQGARKLSEHQIRWITKPISGKVGSKEMTPRPDSTRKKS